MGSLSGELSDHLGASVLTLAKTVHGRWEPGISDQGSLAWATVVSYFVAALLCASLAWRVRRCNGDVREFVWWSSLSTTLVVLGINKQLDLQTLLTQVGRHFARSQGWYEQRRVVQEWFVIGIAFGGLCVLVLLAWLFRGSLWRNALALVGFVFLACFVVIRAASFHHVDVLLGVRVQHVPLHAMLELIGTSCIAIAALFFRADQRVPNSRAGK